MSCEFNRRLARVSAKGWPARETRWIGDWLVRMDVGVSARANSVLPLGAPRDSLHRAIDVVETLYGARGLPPMFQMLDGAVPSDLDRALDERGYQTRSHSAYLLSQTPVAGGRGDLSVRVTLDRHVTEAWGTVWAVGREIRDAEIRRGIFERIQLPCCFAVAWLGDRPVGIGHVGVADGWGWFHGIQTIPEMRGQGVAGAVLDELVEWCRGKGITRFFLQVLRDNDAAWRAYHNAGFNHAFDYWYRVWPIDEI